MPEEEKTCKVIIRRCLRGFFGFYLCCSFVAIRFLWIERKFSLCFRKYLHFSLSVVCRPETRRKELLCGLLCADPLRIIVFFLVCLRIWIFPVVNWVELYEHRKMHWYKSKWEKPSQGECSISFQWSRSTENWICSPSFVIFVLWPKKK